MLLFEIVSGEEERAVLPRRSSGALVHAATVVAVPVLAFAAGRTIDRLLGTAVVVLGMIALLVVAGPHLTRLACRAAPRRWLERGIVVPAKGARGGYREPAEAKGYIDGVEVPASAMRVVSAKTTIRYNAGTSEDPEWKSLPGRTLQVIADGIAYIIGRYGDERDATDDAEALADALGVEYRATEINAPLPSFSGFLYIMVYVLATVALAFGGAVSELEPGLLGLAAVAVHGLLSAFALARWRKLAALDGRRFFEALASED